MTLVLSFFSEKNSNQSLFKNRETEGNVLLFDASEIKETVTLVLCWQRHEMAIISYFKNTFTWPVPCSFLYVIIKCKHWRMGKFSKTTILWVLLFFTCAFIWRCKIRSLFANYYQRWNKVLPSVNSLTWWYFLKFRSLQPKVTWLRCNKSNPITQNDVLTMGKDVMCFS